VADPPGCPQSIPCNLPLPELTCPKRVTEDCLYLNVFTPLSAQPDAKIPVMVFFHGGNFLRGYSGGFLYDGQYIANTSSTVVVTVNYRLGAIGFLVFGEGSDAIEGNYGFKDQRLALHWVQDNIAAFGGDPGQVTIWGQSAGAVSVALHMTTVRSSGLFNKAIMESEPIELTLKDRKHALKLGTDFSKELGCGDKDNIACLYSKNITLISAVEDALLSKIVDPLHALEIFLQWTPTIDGVDILDQPFNLLANGEAAEIPTIIGTVSQEGIFFIYEASPKPLSRVEYDAAVVALFPLHFPAVFRHYPAPEDGQDCRMQLAVAGTDYTFTCPNRYAVRGFINTTAAPTWTYVFNHSISFTSWGQNFTFCDGHSCHGVELPFVFHTAPLAGFNYSQSELELADHMVTYWTNFVHTGNPNGAQDNTTRDLLDWPRYDASNSGKSLRFRAPGTDVISDYQGEICDFWDTVGYNNG
jgi:carboxylesterase type B